MNESKGERIRRIVVESRRAQGLPDKIEDPVTLSRVARMMNAVLGPPKEKTQ